MKVKECMCTDVCCVKPDANLSEVAKLMNEKHVGCIPVCDENNSLCGMTNAESKMSENQIRRLPVCDTNNKVIGILTLGDLTQNNAELGKEEFCTTIENICDCDGNKNAE